MADVEIELRREGGDTQGTVKVDGVEIKYVCDIKLSVKADNPEPTVTLVLAPKTLRVWLEGVEVARTEQAEATDDL